MKGKEITATTCQWIKVEPVDGEQVKATTPEEFLTPQNLLSIFEHRANLLL